MENQAIPPPQSSPNSAIWNKARTGVILILVVHLLVTIIFSGIIEQVIHTKSTPNPITVVLNFFVSRWFIKSKIKSNLKIKKPVLFGLLVSGVLLTISVILQAIYTIWLYN